MSARQIAGLTALAICVLASSPAAAAPFTYDPAGKLVPANSGKGGRVDPKVYAPTMLFPMEKPEAFANSQVYGRGGGSGPGGGQCDKENYSYPWHDNYCEARSWDMPLCPGGTGHQGQDIRPGTCVKNVHNVVAAEDGTITNVGSYSVYLTTASGTRFDYLHMGSVAVKAAQVVKRGALLGKVSNEFGGTPTTIHLHLNIRQTIANVGTVYVPPYTSLVESYQRLLDPNYGAQDAGVDAGPPVVVDASPQPVVKPDSGTKVPPKSNLTPTEPPGDEGCATATPGADVSAVGAGFALLVGAAALLRRRRRA